MSIELDNLSDAEKQQIETAKNELKTALEGTSVDEIKAKTDALTEQFHTISAKMYQQAQAAQGAAGAGPDMNGMGGAAGAGPDMGNMGGQAQGADPNVVDADYEVVDDNK